MEHATEADDEDDRGRDPEDHIREQNLAGTPERQIIPEKHKLDHQGGNQREGRKVVQEGEKRCHSQTSIRRDKKKKRRWPAIVKACGL
jgi:hypothetical protein